MKTGKKCVEEYIESKNDTLSTIVVGLGLCLATMATMGLTLYFNADKNKLIDYVTPSKIEIQCEESDKNGNGQFDKIINVDGKPYLIMENQYGEPILKHYKGCKQNGKFRE